jgi:ADP-heptose:LPS heptosyltransferase/SAM-dependent methyltransferase
MNKDTLTSVILLGESAGDEEIQSAVKNIFEQTHKNIDLIISTFHEEITDDLKKKCSDFFLNVRWVFQQPSPEFIKEAIALAEGDMVFYKTVNNVLWYPRHIEAHIDDFNNDPKLKWGLSHIENRNLDQADSMFNTLSYRIDNPPHPESVTIDEICHMADIDVDWASCLRKEGEVPVFMAGYITKQWIEQRLRGSIPKEITLVQWVSPNQNEDTSVANEEEMFKKIGVPKETEIKEEMEETEDGLEIVRSFPTVMGSFYHKEYSDSINGVINQTENITSIGIKRTIGMGDVVVVEPIIRKLKDKFPQAKITLYTASPKIVEYFECKPDAVEEIDSNSVPFDLLADKDHQVKYDLDLSYESREDISFIDGYAEVTTLEFENEQDKHVKLTYNQERLIKDNKYAVVVADGSAWPGKTWGLENYSEVILWLQAKGYQVVETGGEHTDLTDKKYHGCEFDVMMNLIAHCNLFVGGDNGPMHIARGFNKPCVIVAGAARPYFTSPNRDNVVYVEDHTSKGLGIKHRTFLTVSEKGINFVPNHDEEPTCGLKNIKPPHVVKAIEKLLAKPLSPAGNVMNYEMNIPGNLVFRDVVPGFAYYRDDVTNIIWRENRNYHPDQRIDCSVGYDADKETTWDSRFLPILNYIDDQFMESPGKVLDVGCNMGIFVYGAKTNMNLDVTGIDLNKHAINRAKSIHPDIADKFIHSNFLRYNFDTKFNTLVCSDIVNHVSDPVKFLKKCYSVLDDNGNMFISYYDFGSKSADDKRQQWEYIGVGEIITLFDTDTMKLLLAENNFEIVDNYFEDDETDSVKFLHCRKVN